MKRNLLLLLLLSLVLLGTSCAKTSSVKKQEISSDSEITQVEGEESRVSQAGQALMLATDPNNTALVYESNLLDFEHMASIASPTVSGADLRKMRATSSIKLDNRLYITYMLEGSEFVGALDIVDISGAPTLLSSYRFSNIKLTDLKSAGQYLYLIGGKKNQGATMLVMNIANPVNPTFIKYYVFPGDIATSIDIRQAQILVSSAQNGGYVLFNNENPVSPKYIGFEPIANALSVKGLLASDNSSTLAPLVLGGNTSTKIMFKGEELDISPVASEAPSRVITMGPLLYVGSAAGLTVTELSSGLHGFVRTLPLPGKVNGLAHLDQRIYIAAGNQGLRYISVDEPGNPQELGYFQFQDVGNANNVWVERLNSVEKLIVLSDGQAGIRLVKESKSLSSANVKVQIHAKSKDYLGTGGKLAVYVNNVQVGASIDVSTVNYETYTVSMAQPLVFGDVVKVQFWNDDSTRSVSVAYVKIGEDYFYPWVNNYFNMSNVLINNNDSDNIIMEQGGYYKFTF